MHSNLFFHFNSFIPMNRTEIFIVLVVGFGLGYIFGIVVDPKIFPQPVKTIEKVVEVPVLPDTTNSIAELVSIADRYGIVDVHFNIRTQVDSIFFEKNLKWLGYYEPNQNSSEYKSFIKYDSGNKRVKLASVYYAH